MAELIGIHPDEKILLKLRKHWIILARDLGATATLGILPFVLIFIGSVAIPTPLGLSGLAPFGALLSALWLLLIWLTLAVLWTNYYLDLWIVTDRRIISVDQVNLFQRTVTSLSLEDIQEITVKTEGPLESLLHYGRIAIETSGPDNEPGMEGIPNPEHMRNVILEQIHSSRKVAQDHETQKELFRTASHEIKNYLAKDAAALAEIAEGDYDARPASLKSAAGRALSETRKGVKVAMDILDSAHSGSMHLNAQQFDLRDMVIALAREYEVATTKKDITLEIAAPDLVMINGDAEKLNRLVVKNLLDNALHYTPGGSIRIVLENKSGAARLIVADTGIGIAPEDMERLFTPGGKGAGSTAMNPESTGYGLSIAKAVVEAHGGRIWAESAGKGQGTAFIVELPTA